MDGTDEGLRFSDDTLDDFFVRFVRMEELLLKAFD